MADERGLYIKDENRKTMPQGTHYLFVIGIDIYESVKIKNLNNAVDDALAVKELLIERYQFREENAKVLRDKEATRSAILNQFRYYVGRLEEHDSLLVYHAGHGHYDELLETGYWITTESKEDDLSTYIENGTLLTSIKSMKAKHVFLVSDSCFSGALLEERASGTETERDKNKPSRWGLCSGRKEETVLDKSPFVEYFLYFLKDNIKKELAVDELINYVKQTTANNAVQKPDGGRLYGVGDKRGEYVLELKENEQIAWQNALQQNAIPSYQAFLEKYPQSSYAFQAENYIFQLNEALDEQAYQKASQLDTPLAYYGYIESYPNGKYATEARIKMREKEQAQKEAQAKNALAKAKRNRSLSELMDFKDNYADFPHLVQEANTLIADIKNQKEPPPEPKFQTFEKFETSKTPVVPEDTGKGTKLPPSREGQGRPSLRWGQIQQNKKAIFSGVAILLLLLLLFVFKDKIGGGNSEVNTNQADTSQVVRENSENNKVTDNQSNTDTIKPSVSENSQEINKQNVLVDIKWQDLEVFMNNKGKYGFQHIETKQVIINPIYDEVWSFKEGLAKVEYNDKYGLIDKTGKGITPIKYTHIYSFKDGLAKVGYNGKYGFIDKTGSEIIPYKYEDVDDFSNGLAKIKLNNKYGLIDKKGKEVTPIKYGSLINTFNEGLAIVSFNDKYGFIDKTGNEVIPCKYDAVIKFKKSLAIVRLNNREFTINKRNQCVDNCPEEAFLKKHEITISKYDLLDFSEEIRNKGFKLVEIEVRDSLYGGIIDDVDLDIKPEQTEIEIPKFKQVQMGKFLAVLKTGTNYQLNISADYYETVIFTINTSINNQEKTTKKVIYMDGSLSKTVFQNINFETARPRDLTEKELNASLLPKARAELDRVYTFLLNNPRVGIRIKSYTDDEGSEDYNMALTLRKAEAAKYYLTKVKGLSISRIKIRAFGESKPTVDNNSPANRALNRRVEFQPFIMGEWWL